MKQKPAGQVSSSDQTIRDIKRKTRKQYSVEEKIHIVSAKQTLDKLGIPCTTFYRWHERCRLGGQDRTSAPNAEEPDIAGKLLSTRRS